MRAHLILYDAFDLSEIQHLVICTDLPVEIMQLDYVLTNASALKQPIACPISKIQDLNESLVPLSSAGSWSFALARMKIPEECNQAVLVSLLSP
jgi:hypothetical protein